MSTTISNTFSAAWRFAERRLLPVAGFSVIHTKLYFSVGLLTYFFFPYHAGNLGPLFPTKHPGKRFYPLKVKKRRINSPTPSTSVVCCAMTLRLAWQMQTPLLSTAALLLISTLPQVPLSVHLPTSQAEPKLLKVVVFWQRGGISSKFCNLFSS